ncbi:unnamed protein product [Amoebophrya sp. A25]|nr:unnamed protein product [Amoebophrya sp. A25]|eukprot:GSA25T00013501001.1
MPFSKIKSFFSRLAKGSASGKFSSGTFTSEVSISANPELLAQSPEVDIRDVYEIGKILGSGSFGQVRECKCRQGGHVRAVKIVEADDTDGEWSRQVVFVREVGLLQQLDHENIVKFYDFFEDPDFYYIVMEFYTGGELFQRILEIKRFSECDAAFLGFQMMLALEYIHSLRIVHRDVKAENFLFTAPGSIYNTPLKLIDFGMAVKRQDDQQVLHELCGSPHYLAPELIGQQYNHLVDFWALGVLLYLLMYGRYPYDAKDPQELMVKILTEKIEWRHPKARIGDAAKGFLGCLLDRDVRTRYSSRKAMKHPWVVQNMLRVETHIKPVNKTNILALKFIQELIRDGKKLVPLSRHGSKEQVEPEAAATTAPQQKDTKEKEHRTPTTGASTSTGKNKKTRPSGKKDELQPPGAGEASRKSSSGHSKLAEAKEKAVKKDQATARQAHKTDSSGGIVGRKRASSKHEDRTSKISSPPSAGAAPKQQQQIINVDDAVDNSGAKAQVPGDVVKKIAGDEVAEQDKSSSTSAKKAVGGEDATTTEAKVAATSGTSSPSRDAKPQRQDAQAAEASAKLALDSGADVVDKSTGSAPDGVDSKDTGEDRVVGRKEVDDDEAGRKIRGDEPGDAVVPLSASGSEAGETSVERIEVDVGARTEGPPGGGKDEAGLLNTGRIDSTSQQADAGERAVDTAGPSSSVDNGLPPVPAPSKTSNMQAPQESSSSKIPTLLQDPIKELEDTKPPMSDRGSDGAPDEQDIPQSSAADADESSAEDEDDYQYQTTDDDDEDSDEDPADQKDTFEVDDTVYEPIDIPKEVLHMARRSSIATRRLVDTTFESVRNQKLQFIEEEYKRGLRYGHRMGGPTPSTSEAYFAAPMHATSEAVSMTSMHKPSLVIEPVGVFGALKRRMSTFMGIAELPEAGGTGVVKRPSEQVQNNRNSKGPDVVTRMSQVTTLQNVGAAPAGPLGIPKDSGSFWMKPAGPKGSTSFFLQQNQLSLNAGPLQSSASTVVANGVSMNHMSLAAQLLEKRNNVSNLASVVPISEDPPMDSDTNSNCSPKPRGYKRGATIGNLSDLTASPASKLPRRLSYIGSLQPLQERALASMFQQQIPETIVEQLRESCLSVAEASETLEKSSPNGDEST